MTTNDFHEGAELPTETMTAREAAADAGLWEDVRNGVKEVSYEGTRLKNVVGVGANTITFTIAFDFIVGVAPNQLLKITRLKPPGDYQTQLSPTGLLLSAVREAVASTALDGQTQSNPLWDCEGRLEAVTRERDDLKRQLERYKTALEEIERHCLLTVAALKEAEPFRDFMLGYEDACDDVTAIARRALEGGSE